jgi:hypothetical protein
MGDVLAKGRGTAASSTRENYIIELVCERLTGLQYRAAYQSAEMRWGTEHEDEARAAYEVETGSMVETCGLFDHPRLPMCAASPDGLVDEGLLEVKCPMTRTHIVWMQAGTPPQEHVPQMLLQAACTGRPWVDFVSFDPRLPSDLRLFVVRFEPVPAMIEAAEEAVQAFERDVQVKLAEVLALRAARAKEKA